MTLLKGQARWSCINWPAFSLLLTIANSELDKIFIFYSCPLYLGPYFPLIKFFTKDDFKVYFTQSLCNY